MQQSDTLMVPGLPGESRRLLTYGFGAATEEDMDGPPCLTVARGCAAVLVGVHLMLQVATRRVALGCAWSTYFSWIVYGEELVKSTPSGVEVGRIFREMIMVFRAGIGCSSPPSTLLPPH